MTLPISEIFVSHQGEGPFAGRLSLFVRMMGCPVQCTWCDTPYTWKPGQMDKPTRHSAADILNRAKSADVTNIVLTGGEPMIHQKNSEFTKLVAGWEGTIEIETSGIHLPFDMKAMSQHVHFRVSIKLPSAKVIAKHSDWFAIYRQWLSASKIKWWADQIFKWVITDVADIDHIAKALDHPDSVKSEHWLMPQALTAEELALNGHLVQSAAQALGINYSHRIHVAIHGNKRGV